MFSGERPGRRCYISTYITVLKRTSADIVLVRSRGNKEEYTSARKTHTKLGGKRAREGGKRCKEPLGRYNSRHASFHGVWPSVIQ